MPGAWDYLVLTASNDHQAHAYETQLRRRRELGLLPQVREALVIPDPDGKRVGSGGSTLHCLQTILKREQRLEGLRILIVHAGGDSRRLPAYSPCGKIFVPVPGRSHNTFQSNLVGRPKDDCADDLPVTGHRLSRTVARFCRTAVSLASSATP